MKPISHTDPSARVLAETLGAVRRRRQSRQSGRACLVLLLLALALSWPFRGDRNPTDLVSTPPAMPSIVAPPPLAWTFRTDAMPSAMQFRTEPLPSGVILSTALGSEAGSWVLRTSGHVELATDDDLLLAIAPREGVLVRQAGIARLIFARRAETDVSLEPEQRETTLPGASPGWPWF